MSWEMSCVRVEVALVRIYYVDFDEAGYARIIPQRHERVLEAVLYCQSEISLGSVTPSQWASLLADLVQPMDHGLVEKGCSGNGVGCQPHIHLDEEREEFAAAPVKQRVDDLDLFLLALLRR